MVRVWCVGGEGVMCVSVCVCVCWVLGVVGVGVGVGVSVGVGLGGMCVGVGGVCVGVGGVCVVCVVSVWVRVWVCVRERPKGRRLDVSEPPLYMPRAARVAAGSHTYTTPLPLARPHTTSSPLVHPYTTSSPLPLAHPLINTLHPYRSPHTPHYLGSPITLTPHPTHPLPHPYPSPPPLSHPHRCCATAGMRGNSTCSAR